MQEKKELNWVNVAKAISIITVLFVHTENYYGLEFGEINQFLCGFYVNAFFLISGYCKNILSLGVPLGVIFNIWPYINWGVYSKLGYCEISAMDA